MTPTLRDGESEQGYEELRREILEEGRGRGPGLAIFLRRGMAWWLHELARWAEAAPLRCREGHQCGVPIPSSAKGEIVHALAGMILGLECAQRV